MLDDLGADLDEALDDFREQLRQRGEAERRQPVESTRAW